MFGVWVSGGLTCLYIQTRESTPGQVSGRVRDRLRELPDARGATMRIMISIAANNYKMILAILRPYITDRAEFVHLSLLAR